MEDRQISPDQRSTNADGGVMAGDWIKVEAATPNKPEILKVSRMLGITKDDAFGKVMRFWLWLDSVCVDGHVDGVVSTDVDAVVGTDGFANALKCVGWINFNDEDEIIETPNFDRHNGETAKKRALKNRRQKKWREKVDDPVDTAASTTASTREEKRREDSKKEEAPSLADDKKATPKKSHPIPTDWVPSEKTIQWAIDQGATREFVLGKLVPEFIAYFAETGDKKKTWNVTFMRNPVVKNSIGRFRASGGKNEASRQYGRNGLGQAVAAQSPAAARNSMHKNLYQRVAEAGASEAGVGCSHLRGDEVEV
jgi:hypothetical protein